MFVGYFAAQVSLILLLFVRRWHRFRKNDAWRRHQKQVPHG
jgi:hypothetical protein